MACEHDWTPTSERMVQCLKCNETASLVRILVQLQVQRREFLAKKRDVSRQLEAALSLLAAAQEREVRRAVCCAQHEDALRHIAEFVRPRANTSIYLQSILEIADAALGYADAPAAKDQDVGGASHPEAHGSGVAAPPSDVSGVYSQPPPCPHPFAALGIDGDGAMWCTACGQKPLRVAAVGER